VVGGVSLGCHSIEPLEAKVDAGRVRVSVGSLHMGDLGPDASVERMRAKLSPRRSIRPSSVFGGDSSRIWEAAWNGDWGCGLMKRWRTDEARLALAC
jgi:hypothetical protein